MAVPIDIQRLVFEVPSPPGEPLAEGTSDEEIHRFSVRTGVSIPAELEQWLRFTNGPCIGPGGIYGISPRRRNLDIEQTYRFRPEWRSRNWIPIAGDGCGNEYILAADKKLGSSFPVFFFDHEQGDPTRIAYFVGSGLWSFLRFLLQHELGERRWPFNAEFVLESDPELSGCSKLPWINEEE
jgi:hypothetical protein